MHNKKLLVRYFSMIMAIIIIASYSDLAFAQGELFRENEEAVLQNHTDEGEGKQNAEYTEDPDSLNDARETIDTDEKENENSISDEINPISSDGSDIGIEDACNEEECSSEDLVSTTEKASDELIEDEGDSSGFILGTSNSSLSCRVEDNVLNISGTGSIAGFSSEIGAGDWDELKKSIKLIVLEEGITEISENAFAGCTSLETVTLPDSLRTICDDAFNGAALSNGISIPQGVSSIADNAFTGATSLRTISNASDATVYLPTVSSEEGCWIDCNSDNHIFDGIEKIVNSEARVAQRYAITYHGNFTGCIQDGVKKCYLAGEWYKISSCEEDRPGYTIDSWNTKADATGKFYSPKDSIRDLGTNGSIIDLYAQWKARDYNVVFDANGGGVSCPQISVTYGAAYGALPQPNYEGHIFKGWYTDKNGGELITEETILSCPKDQILYAHWDYDVVTITFNPDGGECSETTKKVFCSGTYGSLPEPSRYGYVFKGWTTEDVVGFVNENSIVQTNADHELIANWAPKSVQIRFESEGKTLDTIKELEFGEVYGELEHLSCSGAKFCGWYTSKDYDYQVLPESVVDNENNHILYAKWEYKYTVSVPIVNVDCECEIESGTYVSLSCATTGSTIYYTTDASIGLSLSEENGTVYQDAIRICEDTTIIAFAKRNGYFDSEKASFTYHVKNDAWGDITDADKVENELNSYDQIPKGLWASGVSDCDYTGSSIAFSSLKVFYGKKLLNAGSDYSVSYSNNIKPGVAKVIIQGKNNYSGKITYSFNILRLSLGENGNNSLKVSIPDLVLSNNGKAQKLNPTVIYVLNGKSVILKTGTDYICTYDSTKNYKDEGEYSVTVTGKGVYCGQASGKIIIKDDKTAINRLKVDKIKDVYATGAPIEPVLVVRDGQSVLEKNIDYDVTYLNNFEPGKAYAVITGIGKYSGTKIVSFNIKAYAISKALVTGIVPQEYSGEATTQSTYTLTYKFSKNGDAIQLREGTDYIVGYSNNTDASKKAKIIFKGINRFSGKLEVKYSILPHLIADGDVIPTVIGEVDYQKKKTVPSVTVMFGDKILKEGKDYKIKCLNNTSINDGSDSKKVPEIVIKGAGNFSGTVKRQFSIKGGSLAFAQMKLSDVIYADKPGVCKPSIVLLDTNGTKLTAGKDYDIKNVVYRYVIDTEVQCIDNKVRSTVLREEGSVVDLKKDIIPVGTEISATVTGLNNYKGSSSTAVFRFVKASIAKATITIPQQTYTGSQIILKKGQISVRVGTTELRNSDYEILGYQNNTNKGAAKVTIRGIGNYGGEKTAFFNIVAKNMQFVVKYDSNDVYMSNTKPYTFKAQGKVKDSTTSNTCKVSPNTYKRSGYSFAGWNTSPDGTGKTYIVGENIVFHAEKEGMISYGDELILYAQWSPVRYRATFWGNGTGNYDPIFFTIEDNIVLPTPLVSGGVFSGWFTDKKYKNQLKCIQGTYGNKTLYAKIDWNIYSVSFNANGGKGKLLKNLNCIYGKKYALPSPTFSKKGFTFSGWNTMPDGSGIAYVNKQKISNLVDTRGGCIVLYAQWKPISYSIKYVLNGGSNNIKNPLKYTAQDDIVLLDPVKSGNSFNGWFYDSKFKNRAFSIAGGKTGNLTLYAKWSKYSYTIRFDGNGATSGGMSDIRTVFDKSITLPKNKFTKQNFSFTAWNTKPDGSGVKFNDATKVSKLCSNDGEIITLYAQWTLKGIAEMEGPYEVNLQDETYKLDDASMWLFSAELYDSNGTKIASAKANDMGYGITFSFSKVGTYYIRYEHSERGIKHYTKPIYIDGQLVYSEQYPKGEKKVTVRKLSVVIMPQTVILDYNNSNGKTYTSNSNSSVCINSSNWIYTCKVLKDGNEYLDSIWDQKSTGVNSYYEIGVLNPGTYTISVQECNYHAESRMVYKDGKLVYESTGYYEPETNSIVKTWSTTVIVQ